MWKFIIRSHNGFSCISLLLTYFCFEIYKYSLFLHWGPKTSFILIILIHCALYRCSELPHYKGGSFEGRQRALQIEVQKIQFDLQWKRYWVLFARQLLFTFSSSYADGEGEGGRKPGKSLVWPSPMYFRSELRDVEIAVVRELKTKWDVRRRTYAVWNTIPWILLIYCVWHFVSSKITLKITGNRKYCCRIRIKVWQLWRKTLYRNLFYTKS